MRLPITLLVILGISELAVAAPPVKAARKTNPPYLASMPTLKEVEAGVVGKDNMDTAARQMGAFWQLQQMVQEMAGPRKWKGQFTPDENRLIGEYRLGYANAGQPYESFADKQKWSEAHAFYENDTDFRVELLQKFAPPDLRRQYEKLLAENEKKTEQRKQRYQQGWADAKERTRKHEEMVKQWLANPPVEVQEYLARQENRNELRREIARGLASGRSETQVFVEAIGKDLTQMMHPLLSDTPPQPGLAMAGSYTGSDGFTIWFYPDFAILGSGQVKAEAGYAMVRQDNQLQIKLIASPRMGLMKVNEDLAKLARRGSAPDQWQGQRIILTLEPDGKITGMGRISVTGSVQTGTREGTRTTYDARGVAVKTEPISEPVYEAKTITCEPGTLSPSGSSPAAGSITTLVSRALALGSAEPGSAKMPPPGLRMNGRYFGQNQFDVEFFPESAVLSCGEVVCGRDYQVTRIHHRLLIKIDNGDTPIELELRPDGTLAGSGTVQVNGRIMTGTNAHNEPVFKASTIQATLGVLTARNVRARIQGSSGAAEGTAVLSVESGLSSGGFNPMGGKTFYLLKQSVQTVLSDAGVAAQPQASAFKSWMIAAQTNAPELKKGQAAIDANSAGMIRLEADGTGRFAPVAPGTYYVMGMARHSEQLLLWDVKVDLKTGANSIKLAHDNATEIK